MFSDRIKTLRKEKNMTQKQLANLLNLSSNAVCEWEKCRSEPSYETLIKIAGFFDVSTDYLLGREDDFGVVNTEEFLCNKDEYEVLNLYKALTPPIRKAIKETLKNLVNHLN